MATELFLVFLYLATTQGNRLNQSQLWHQLLQAACQSVGKDVVFSR
ncbi:hypothetical protein SynBIOSE41_01727 [Synechococcus sp. BIOS-E4-1]|nr:hypothetical protein SynBIOSE41_01727 [Synechococcus sp. BIOS-E4-1]